MRIISLLLVLVLLTGCVSLVPESELSMWAVANGYIHKNDIPITPPVPERQALPHPNVPKLEIKDSEGNYIEITEQYLMKTIITLLGTVEKYQYLAEIYEREYLNTDGKIMKDLTLEELKSLYLEKVKSFTKTEAIDPVTGFPSTESVEEDVDINDLEKAVDIINQLQKEREGDSGNESLVEEVIYKDFQKTIEMLNLIQNIKHI